MYKIQLTILLLLIAGAPFAEARTTLAVKRVIEADILELSDGKRVRLIGVSTPSINDVQTNRRLAAKYKLDPGTVQVYAFAARKFVQNVIEEQFIYLTYDDAHKDKNHQDADGMTLVYAWFPIYFRDSRDQQDDSDDTVLGISSEDRLLNADILRLGYGFADRGSHYSKKKLFIEFEKTAKKNKKGLWGSGDVAYEAQLERVQAAHIAATSDFVVPAVRKVGYNFAVKALKTLIKTNPNDYRAFYERSWMGAHQDYDKVTAANLKDINRARVLAPNEPSVHAQKHYLLRLIGKHQSAVVSYDRAVFLTPEFFGETLLTSGVRRGLKREALLLDLGEGTEVAGLLEDAYRAGLNEDHFLFFMARFKELQKTKYSGAARTVFDSMLRQEAFHQFNEKHRTLINRATPHGLIYATHYAKTARLDPEGALAFMNKKNKKNKEG